MEAISLTRWRNSTIRALTTFWRSSAARYSEFSRRSPNSRARLISLGKCTRNSDSSSSNSNCSRCFIASLKGVSSTYVLTHNPIAMKPHHRMVSIDLIIPTVPQFERTQVLTRRFQYSLSDFPRLTKFPSCLDHRLVAAVTTNHYPLIGGASESFALAWREHHARQKFTQRKTHTLC